MKKLLKDPLIHFLIIGASLFLLFELLGSPESKEQDTIVISSADIKALQANFARTWLRQPTKQELSRVIDERVRGEIAYREALAMGLDKQDETIRRRLRMKMELMLEDIAGITAPTDEQLMVFLEKHSASFRKDPLVTFTQVFINLENHGAAAETYAGQILAQLRQADPGTDVQALGDPIMLPPAFQKTSTSVIARQFGKDFARKLLELPPGEWGGPLSSGYGLHLTLVEEIIPGRIPDLDEVRREVERDWLNQQREMLVNETYRKLRDRYHVIIEAVAQSDA